MIKEPRVLLHIVGGNVILYDHNFLTNQEALAWATHWVGCKNDGDMKVCGYDRTLMTPLTLYQKLKRLSDG